MSELVIPGCILRAAQQIHPEWVDLILRSVFVGRVFAEILELVFIYLIFPDLTKFLRQDLVVYTKFEKDCILIKIEIN